jgi:hypothetical protein
VKGEAKMAQADLSPVPHNGSLWRPKGKKLIVEIQNVGDAPAKATITRLDYRGYGTIEDPTVQKQEMPTPKLKPGEKYELAFDLPCDECFDPDCEFSIMVDVDNVLLKEDTRGNVFRGVGRK